MSQDPPPPGACARTGRATAICRYAAAPPSRESVFLAHDLVRKPVPTFRDHALTPLLGICFELLLERRELGKRRVRVGSLVAPLLGRARDKQAPFARRA